ncbi:streptophobe family protein [Streptomyces sp. NPDC020875]|uniref:streptophobe family protein n=1 Tax=Streptomyces sp. NPDC020875 TaxID=3154898 RepID=UPI0033CEAF04
MAGTDGSGGRGGPGYGRTGRRPAGRALPWADVLLCALAAVGWAFVAMAGAAALGLRLLNADAEGRLGPMTAAVVVLAVGGSVVPAGDVSLFGLTGAEAGTSLGIAPLGVALAGALPLAVVFLRSLRRAGAVSWRELAARAGTVALLFTATTAGLARAGRDVVTFDGERLVPDGGGDGGGTGPGGRWDPGGLRLPDGLGDLGRRLGDSAGRLPGRLAELVDARAAVGFRVEAADSVPGALVWVAGVLLIALVAGRAALPGTVGRWHDRARPAASALVSVLLGAVVAGYAAAGYAAVGDEHPRLIAGSALLGAPNGVWLGVPLGLFVPVDGRADGALARAALPDPLDEFFRGADGEPATVARLAELDSRVWLLAVAAAVLMLHAGVLAAARTPFAGRGAAAYAVRCALWLGALSAVALPLLVRLTEVSVGASLSLLGFDAFGAGIAVEGRPGWAAALGAVWGAGAGGAGALLVYAAGRRGRARLVAEPVPPGGAPGPVDPYGPAGREAGPYGTGAGPESGPYGTGNSGEGPYDPAPPYRPPNPGTNPYLRRPPDDR